METSGPMLDWPLEHAYVAKAAPRPGSGWLVRIFTHDDQAPDQARLVGTAACANLKQLEETAWQFVHDLDPSPDVHIAAAPELDNDVMARVIGAWKAMSDAKEAEAAAARQIRDVVADLRALGLSLADIAFLTNLSRGRISQLLLDTPES